MPCTSSKTTTRHKLTNTAQSSSSIEQLRQERLKREDKERARAQALLSETTPQDTSSIKHEKESRFYHSQFHPELHTKKDRYKPY